MHKEENRQNIEITLWQLDFTRKILLRWRRLERRQWRRGRCSRNKHSVVESDWFSYFLPQLDDFFSHEIEWLFHFDEFFDETKLWARFQQETCQDALIALWQHVFTRKIILIFNTSVSALIGLRAPSKTNNLKGWLNPPLPSYIKETYLWKCVMLLLSDWQFDEKNCATNRSSSLIFPFPM